MRLFLAVLVLGISLSSYAQEFKFKRRGEVIATLTLDQMKQRAPDRVLPIFEPHEGVEKKYRGLPFRDLLQSVYGDSWKKAEEMLFTCSDGYQPSVPAGEFAKHTSLLAFELPGAPFKVNNKFQNEKQIELGPYYLVWDNVSEPALKGQSASHWPYQVIAVDLIQFKDRFPHMAPPDGSSAAAKRGFLAFKSSCMNCHAVNGEGAPKSVELNYPASVTEYFKEGWLEKWILDPTSVRHNSTMPALSVPDAKKVAKEIVAYLKTMAKHKKKPQPHPEH